MVIGTFFSELGTSLLRVLAEKDARIDAVRGHFNDGKTPPEKSLKDLRRLLNAGDADVVFDDVDWTTLRESLLSKRSFLVRLLENQTHLERESFTDLLWAVFHLTEELQARTNLENPPETDGRHLAGDVKRVYRRLASLWLDYMNHLRTSYPYLFSLSTRLNPFDPNPSPVVSE